jgi:phosphoglucomutase
LNELYLKHGFFAEKMINIFYEGAIGAQKIANILKSYRENPPKTFGEIKVNSVKDFGVSDIYDEDGELISKQDFFFLECSHGFSFAVRGSGTEPKIKFYVFGQKALSEDDTLSEIQSAVGTAMKEFMELIEADAHTRAV